MVRLDLTTIKNLLKSAKQATPQDDRYKVGPGDTVEVHVKVALKPKVERRLTAAEKQLLKQKLQQGFTKEQLEEQAMQTQVFKGVIIAIKGEGESKSIVVRRIGANEIGIERTFPLDSPVVVKVKRTRAGHPRRAKLYYLRERQGKKRLYVRYREKA